MRVQEDGHKADEGIPASSDSVRIKKDGAVVVVDPSFGSSIAPCSEERTLRSRIDKFVAGYALTPMGKAVALNWITVRLVCLRWLYIPCAFQEKKSASKFLLFFCACRLDTRSYPTTKDIGAPHNKQPFFYPRKVRALRITYQYEHQVPAYRLMQWQNDDPRMIHCVSAPG